MEYPPYHNPGTIFCKVTHKRREAEEGVGVPGEISCGATCTFELLEAEEEFQGSWWFGKDHDNKFWDHDAWEGLDVQNREATFPSNHGSSRNPQAQCSTGSCKASLFSPCHINFADIEATFYVNACNMGVDCKLSKQVNSSSWVCGSQLHKLCDHTIQVHSNKEWETVWPVNPQVIRRCLPHVPREEEW